MEIALTRHSTSSCPGSGVSTSRTENSLGPVRSKAFILSPFSNDRQRADHRAGGTPVRRRIEEYASGEERGKFLGVADRGTVVGEVVGGVTTAVPVVVLPHR